MTLDSGIRNRILGAVGAEALGHLLNIGIRVMLVPLYLSAWGAPIYGEWLILSALAAWFGLGDFGGQLYFVNRMTTAWAAGRREEFQRILATGMLFFISSSGALFCCVALASFWPGWFPWMGLTSVSQHVARIVLLIMAFRFLIALPVGLMLAVFRATGSQATSVMYVNLTLVIHFAGTATALLTGAGILTLAALEVAPILAVSFLIVRDLRRRLQPDIRLFALGRADRSIISQAISPSLHFMGIQLALIIVIQGSVIAVAKTLGPVEVAVFSTMRTVSNVVAQFLAMLNHSAWPEFTRLHSTKQEEKLTYLFKLILCVTLLAGIIYILILRNFGGSLYSWWLDQKLPYQPWVMFFMGCQVILTAMWTQGGSLLMATNQHEQYARMQVGVNLLAITLCFLGAENYGLRGAVLGLMLGQSLPMLGIVVTLLRRKGMKPVASWLVGMSLAALLVFPLCLNRWSGLAVVALFAGAVTRYFGWRVLSARGATVS